MDCIASCSLDAFSEQSHALSDAQFADYEADDPFVENVIATISKCIATFEPLLIPENYQVGWGEKGKERDETVLFHRDRQSRDLGVLQDLLSVVCVEVSRQFERVLYKSVFNRLGALQLDKQLRQLTAYLTSAAGWTVREKTARIAQVGGAGEGVGNRSHCQ